MACILTTFYESLFLKIQEKGALFLKTMFSCGCQESTKPGLKRRPCSAGWLPAGTKPEKNLGGLNKSATVT
jgi:hypothetical protein